MISFIKELQKLKDAGKTKSLPSISLEMFTMPFLRFGTPLNHSESWHPQIEKTWDSSASSQELGKLPEFAESMTQPCHHKRTRTSGRSVSHYNSTRKSRRRMSGHQSMHLHMHLGYTEEQWSKIHQQVHLLMAPKNTMRVLEQPSQNLELNLIEILRHYSGYLCLILKHIWLSETCKSEKYTKRKTSRRPGNIISQYCIKWA